MPKPSASAAALITAGDVIDVRVFGQDSMSARGPVRGDGTFTLPLLGRIAVAGQRPEQLAESLKGRLRPYVNAPEVTVSIQESRVSVALIGEVRQVGIVELDSPANVLQALARAGGVTEFADTSSIFVLRSINGATRRIRFEYSALVDAEPAAIGFVLRSGDVVVVE